MKNKEEKVVIFTNIFIHFLISNSYNNLDKILKTGKYKLLLSKELLEEFIVVVNRPKFRKYFSSKEISNLLNSLQDYAELEVFKSKIDKCRDFKDNFLLSLCKDGNADYLITGDKDLLVLKKIHHTKIITINEFIEMKTQK
jgi:putative PIN family toxin of toxin-antitoxin system